jgi:hypothetical protein
MGTAVATAITSVMHNILRFGIIKWKLKMQPFNMDSLRILLIIPIALFLALLIHVNNPYMLIFLRGLASAVVFLLLLILFKVFTVAELKEEFTSVKKTFL